MAKKQSIAEHVKADEAALKAMTTANELRQWAVSKGMDNRAAFPRFKNALLDIGVDYAAIRAGRTAERREELDTAITHRVTLYSDAKASQDRYAITDADGSPLWYGRFFDSDRDYDGEQSSGELAAASKAIWLASKVAEAIGSTAIRLDLYVDAQWLLYQDGPKQKGFALTRAANRLNVDLHLHWIPGKENPADEWTTASGYKKWQDNDLKALAVPLTGDEPEATVPEEMPMEEKPQPQKFKSENQRTLEMIEAGDIDSMKWHIGATWRTSRYGASGRPMQQLEDFRGHSLLELAAAHGDGLARQIATKALEKERSPSEKQAYVIARQIADGRNAMAAHFTDKVRADLRDMHRKHLADPSDDLYKDILVTTSDDSDISDRLKREILAEAAAKPATAEPLYKVGQRVIYFGKESAVKTVYPKKSGEHRYSLRVVKGGGTYPSVREDDIKPIGPKAEPPAQDASKAIAIKLAMAKAMAARARALALRKDE